MRALFPFPAAYHFFQCAMQGRCHMRQAGLPIGGHLLMKSAFFRIEIHVNAIGREITVAFPAGKLGRQITHDHMLCVCHFARDGHILVVSLLGLGYGIGVESI